MYCFVVSSLVLWDKLRRLGASWFLKRLAWWSGWWLGGWLDGITSIIIQGVDFGKSSLAALTICQSGTSWNWCEIEPNRRKLAWDWGWDWDHAPLTITSSKKILYDHVSRHNAHPQPPTSIVSLSEGHITATHMERRNRSLRFLSQDKTHSSKLAAATAIATKGTPSSSRGIISSWRSFPQNPRVLPCQSRIPASFGAGVARRQSSTAHTSKINHQAKAGKHQQQQGQELQKTTTYQH